MLHYPPDIWKDTALPGTLNWDTRQTNAAQWGEPSNHHSKVGHPEIWDNYVVCVICVRLVWRRVSAVSWRRPCTWVYGQGAHRHGSELLHLSSRHQSLSYILPGYLDSDRMEGKNVFMGRHEHDAARQHWPPYMFALSPDRDIGRHPSEK